MSENQKKVRDDFEAKRRKEARDDALKEKQRRKRVGDHYFFLSLSILSLFLSVPLVCLCF